MIRFFHAKILTMKEEALEEGEVWVHENKIVFVGVPKVPLPAFDREIDLKGNVIMPGFKNAHTHSSMTFLRSFADDLPLQEWLEKQVFPLEAKLTPKDVYELAKIAIAEYVTSGITANFDMYFFPEEVAKSSIEFGFRTVFLGTTSNIDAMVHAYETINHMDPLVSYRFGIHAEYTNTLPFMKEVSALLHKYKEPCFMHSSESANEVQGCLQRYGKTPTELFDDLGLYDYGGGAFHCCYLSEHDYEIFQKRGLYVVTCPASNLKLASGIAPIAEMRRRNLPVAIGTDGPASNNCLDMFREMFLVTGLQKVKEKDASSTPAYDVLRMATVEGAHAMGLWDADVLEERKLADLIVINLHRPNMQPCNDIIKNIVYSGSKENIYLTMVNGKILYENGEFYFPEEMETVYRNCTEIMKRLTK